MDATARAALLSLAVLLTLAGCGGGGGSGDPAPPTGPAPPSGGGSAAPVAITAANAPEVAVVGTSLSESFVQIGLSALDNVFDLSDSRLASTSLSCSFGSGTATHADNDASGTISDGDTVEIVYDECVQDSLGSSAIGRVDVSITSLDTFADQSTSGELRITVADGFTFNAGGDVEIEASGSFDLAVVATPELENLTITASGTQSMQVVLTSDSASVTELARDVSIERRLGAANDYRITTALSLESELVGGTFDCATDTPLGGTLEQFPDTGVFECTGAAGSTVRVVTIDASAVRTEVDPEGDGSFVDAGVVENGNGNWGDYLEGQFISVRLDLPRDVSFQVIQTVSSASLVVAVNDAVFSDTDGLLYVTNDNGLVVVDPQSMSVVGSLAMSDRPRPLAVSDDGTTLWVGFEDVGEIVPVSTAGLTAGIRVALGPPAGTAPERFAAQLGVVPGTNDTVVVAMKGDQEMVAYRAGAPLPNFVLDHDAPTDFEFRDATSIIGIGDSTTAFPASLISVDENGVTLEKALRGFSQGFNGHLSLGSNLAYINSGRVFDVDNETIIGRIDLTGGPFRDGVHVDSAASRAYFYDDFTDVLDFYDTATLTALGAWRMPSNGTLLDILETNDERLLLVLDAEIHAVDKALLAPTARDSCETIELNGQLGLDFFVRTSCPFNDAVYDTSRDLVYASVPGAAGPNGNSIAVIDPRTGTIRDYIFVGSEPTQLSISGSGNRLYVALSEATLVAEVDLQSQAVASLIKVLPEPVVPRPQMPIEVAASPVLDGDVLVAKRDGAVALYMTGTQAPNVVNSHVETQHLSYADGGATAFGVDTQEILSTFEIDGSGIVLTGTFPDLLVHDGVRNEGGILFDILGRVVDAATATLLGTCPVELMAAVAPDPASDDVYYLNAAFDSEILVCDSATFTLGAPVPIPRFGGPVGAVRAMMKAGPDRLVITSADKMLFLDPTEF